MSSILMAAWDGAGAVPPLMSVARALVDRGHDVRVLADPVLSGDVATTGARHVPWTTAPHRRERTRETLFIEDYGPEGFAAMRDNLAVGAAGAFAADVLAELDREPADVVLSETLLFGPLVAAEGAGVPCVVLNPTINMVPAEGVPPFGPGFLPATDEADRQRDRQVAEAALAAWDEALPALNAARAEHGLPPLDHVLDQGRSAAKVLVMTSRAFDFAGGALPPTVVHVGPRLDDIADADPWTPPPGDDPVVLVGLSSDFQDHEDLLRRIVTALGSLPVRGVVTTGRGIDPADIPAPPNVQVTRLAPHREVMAVASAVVTHCGHGTTIKALAAGLPLVCLPLGRDQLDVAARVVHRGAGLRLDPTESAESIARAVSRVLEQPGYCSAAEHLAAQIAEETSRDRVVEEVEALLAQRTAGQPLPSA